MVSNLWSWLLFETFHFFKRFLINHTYLFLVRRPCLPSIFPSPILPNGKYVSNRKIMELTFRNWFIFSFWGIFILCSAEKEYFKKVNNPYEKINTFCNKICIKYTYVYLGGGVEMFGFIVNQYYFYNGRTLIIVHMTLTCGLIILFSGNSIGVLLPTLIWAIVKKTSFLADVWGKCPK